MANRDERGCACVAPAAASHTRRRNRGTFQPDFRLKNRLSASGCVSLASGGTSVASADRVSAVAPDGLAQGDSTPGIVREVAFATERALHVRGRVNGGVVSGWHHHGDREVLGYV